MLSRISLITKRGNNGLQIARAIPRLLNTTAKSNSAETAVDTPKSKSFWDVYKDKAGLSAPTVFGVGLASFLLSKEIFIIHEETLLAAVMGGTIYWMVKSFGKQVADGLDSYSQNILDTMNEGRMAKIQALKEAISEEKSIEEVYSSRETIYNILEENNTMNLEIEYRKNLHHVHDEVKKRLDYQLELQNLKTQLEQAHIVGWVEDAVIKSITTQQEKDALTQCIKDINSLAVARA
eukprot:gene12848-14170_t